MAVGELWHIYEYIILEDFLIDKYVFDNSNGLWYEQIGDYYIPCLTLPAEEEKPIGVTGSGTYTI